MSNIPSTQAGGCASAVGHVDGEGHVTWFDPIPEGGALLYSRPASSTDPVAWHSKEYGTCWMHLQPYHLQPGIQFFMRGRDEPVATVESGACIRWNFPTAEIPHGTFFYTSPEAAPGAAAAAPGLQNQLVGALENCVAFIEDAHILEAQWGWEPVETAKAAIAAAQQGAKA